MTPNQPDIAVYLYGPTSGGATRRSLTLAGEFAKRGFGIDIVFANPRGPLEGRVPSAARQVVLDGAFSRIPPLLRSKRAASRFAIPALGRYLRKERPRVLLSAANSVHLSAAVAHHRWGGDTKLALRVCNHLSGSTGAGLRPPRPMERLLARHYVPRADFVIAGSESVADDLVAVSGIARDRIRIAYNPVVDEDLEKRAQEDPGHPWFRTGEPPVVLSVGRIVAQKDYPTLVRAFARLRAHQPARLVILGEAKTPKRRHRILTLAQELGVAEDVDLVGLVANPYAYMARARIFALSSAWEGLPGVLIEALACGCPVVSTDSPGGSKEVLAGGQYGELVGVGDAPALGDALERALAVEPDRKALRRRAADFSVDESVRHTLEALGLSGEGPA